MIFLKLVANNFGTGTPEYHNFVEEGCQSGRMGRPRKPLWPPGHRGFESHTFRHRSYVRGLGIVAFRTTSAPEKPGVVPRTTELADVHRRRQRCPNPGLVVPLGEAQGVAGICLARPQRGVGNAGERERVQSLGCGPERFVREVRPGGRGDVAKQFK